MSEAEVVNGLNNFLGDEGIAYRRKQHRFTSQFADVLVDSGVYPPLAIEHKSWKTDTAARLYWRQHFSFDTDGNFLEATDQFHRVQEFCDRAGRIGFLAAEMRHGAGKPRELALVQWKRVVELYEAYAADVEGSIPGLSPEWFRENALVVTYSDGQFPLDEEFFSLVDVIAAKRDDITQ